MNKNAEVLDEFNLIGWKGSYFYHRVTAFDVERFPGWEFLFTFVVADDERILVGSFAVNPPGGRGMTSADMRRVRYGFLERQARELSLRTYRPDFRYAYTS